MSLEHDVARQLAGAQGRRDFTPNAELAARIADEADGRGKARVDLSVADVALLNGMQLSHVFFCFTPEGKTTFVSSVATTQVIW